jgi:hypothetical protein
VPLPDADRHIESPDPAAGARPGRDGRRQVHPPTTRTISTESLAYARKTGAELHQSVTLSGRIGPEGSLARSRSLLPMTWAGAASANSPAEQARDEFDRVRRSRPYTHLPRSPLLETDSRAS